MRKAIADRNTARDALIKMRAVRSVALHASAVAKFPDDKDRVESYFDSPPAPQKPVVAPVTTAVPVLQEAEGETEK